MRERDTEFAKAFNEARSFIQSDGNFTLTQLKEWAEELNPSLCRRLLRTVIFSAWANNTGKEE